MKWYRLCTRRNEIKAGLLFFRKCRSIADDLMQNAAVPVVEVPNAAKVRLMSIHRVFFCHSPCMKPWKWSLVPALVP